MMENRVLWGYEGEARGRGESEGLSCCLTRQGCPSILADVDVIKYQFHDISSGNCQEPMSDLFGKVQFVRNDSSSELDGNNPLVPANCPGLFNTAVHENLRYNSKPLLKG
jgi:hypothetical protein